MATYFLRKVLYAIPSLLGISFIIFAVLSLAPGDPLAEFGANPEVPAEVRENIKRTLGLDQPSRSGSCPPRGQIRPPAIS